MKCGSEAGQDVNIVNVLVLEGTVEKQGNSISGKSKLFLLEMKIDNQKCIGCNCSF
jgi:hypothetical protein